jgi:hypothetical protein
MFYEMRWEGVKNAMSINMGDNKSEYETFTLTHCWRMRMRATEVGGYDEQEKFLHSSFVSTLSAFI